MSSVFYRPANDSTKLEPDEAGGGSGTVERQ